jgi:hypothetical protein
MKRSIRGTGARPGRSPHADAAHNRRIAHRTGQCHRQGGGTPSFRIPEKDFTIIADEVRRHAHEPRIESASLAAALDGTSAWAAGRCKGSGS